jgi:diacylglycerol kinase (ATP)
MSRDRPLIIVNNTAAKSRQVRPLVCSKLRDRGISFDCEETISPGDATAKARNALLDGRKTIAVVGGDGTLSEAAEGFFDVEKEHTERLPAPIKPEATLAILPSGTGDDFARGLIGKRAPLGEWIEKFVAYCREPETQATRMVDVLYGACNDYKDRFICVNASTMGIGGETAARVAAQRGLLRHLSGELRFMIAALGALAGWRERRVRISVDGDVVIECPTYLVAVANGLFAGGGMMFSPKARNDDGKLDVISACGLTRAEVIRELPRIHKGGHTANPKVSITQGTRVRVETFMQKDSLLIEVDGNVRGLTPAEFQVLPGALRFLGETDLSSSSILVIFASRRRWRSSPLNRAATKARTSSSASSTPVTRAPRHKTLQSSCSRDWCAE